MPLAKSNPLRRILVTAGPTREMLDPVRFITNLSTGEMGYAVAREAKRRGFRVTLISGPCPLKPPAGVRFVPIVTVEELERALQRYFWEHDALIMAAAVGDFIPVRTSLKKIPRKRHWRVVFRSAPDLVRKFAAKKEGRVVIGFALETERWLERSREKRIHKQLDGIVANFFSKKHNPFGRARVRVALIDARGSRTLPFASKEALAERILEWVLRLGKK